MELAEDKENIMPATSSDPLQRKGPSLSPAKKSGKKGRSKSIGPGSLEEPEPPKQSAKDRRKSAFVPATKSILSKNEESERAARRKSMMNRRVSFAPEATLHTWDVILDAKDHTTSTGSAESTRRASGFSQASSSPAASSDASQEDEDAELLSPPTSLPNSQRGARSKNGRRSSGIPPMNFNNPDDAYSSSGVSGSEDESGGEDDDEDAEKGSDDETGTAMSLDVDESTVRSAAVSEDSTSSSERLEASLRQAAQVAGTRGIEYDEFGEMSMELVGDEITNALKPWAQRQPSEVHGSASLDQENVNPFSPAFKAEVIHQEQASDDENEDDMSMDVTHAVGRILKNRPAQPHSSPASDRSGDGTMELTQAVGKITSQKRRRSSTDVGSPPIVAPSVQPKRRRSSVARSSMGDETMDLTMAVGGIQATGSPMRPEQRRRSLRKRRSSGIASEPEDGTMDFTQVVGGIKGTTSKRARRDESFDGNEELSMELTTALGAIGGDEQSVAATNVRPVTPQTSQSPVRLAANTTPKDQERFKDTPDLGAKQLLTPILLQQAQLSNEKRASSGQPSKLSFVSPAQQHTIATTEEKSGPGVTQPRSQEQVAYPELPPVDHEPSPARTPIANPLRLHNVQSPNSEQLKVAVQLQAPELSPTLAKQHRSSPVKGLAVTPDKLNLLDEETRDLSNSFKLLITPRKEALKKMTPKKQSAAKQSSPVKAITPRGRPTPKARDNLKAAPSPIQRLNEDLKRMKASGEQVEKVELQDFLAKAGIRFMDLTTTKRRMTTAPTPSKAGGNYLKDEEVTLESGIVAAACTVPELELYQHACHELKRYTKEGKQMIAELEAATLRDQPPLIQAYMNARPDRKAALDAQMRDMKTDARYRSKDLWYAWRSQLLEELMGGLQTIGEGLIKDDEILGRSEDIIDQVLPPLTERRAVLQQEADRLETSVNAVSEDEKEELNSARDRLGDVNYELTEKRRTLASLRQRVQEQDSKADHLNESKDEFNGTIQEANRIREACRGVSLNEIMTLRESVKQLEDTFGWSITSSSSTPPSITMAYKSEVQLFFHPKAFWQSTQGKEGPNAPIRLAYIADAKRPLTTTLRFFLQLLQASLHGLPQCTTKISDFLALVSDGWDMASAIAESERRLNLEAPTESRIVSDEQLAVSSNVLLTKVKTKVRATFRVTACVGVDLRMSCFVEPSVVVVYGEQYNEKNMTEFVKSVVGDGYRSWDAALREMREKLVARGPKGARK